MKFIETKLKGAYLVEPELFKDSRGFFTQIMSRRELAAMGCNGECHECNVAFNHRAGTLRGMHLQIAPYAQSKLVRCTTGAIWDAIIDLRKDSPTYMQWDGVELTAQNRRQLYIPEGFGHGYITLTDDTEVLYQTGNVYNVESSRGVRWNDPAFNIKWPVEVKEIIARDNEYPDFKGQF